MLWSIENIEPKITVKEILRREDEPFLIKLIKWILSIFRNE